MLTSNELELRSSLTLGTLESNAEAIRDIVKAKLQDYTPENYIGKADEAKSDRAVLNNAEKALNAKRLELERAYMEPFNKFKATITETCKAIKQASAGLDEIVKGEEEREKAQKLEEIRSYWNETQFSLFDFERVINPKWTNKTTKLKDVKKEIDEIQAKTFQDLKILENFPAEDVPLLKTVYLQTLDITAAMQQAETLKANREKLAREKIEREEIAKKKALENQRAEETAEVNQLCKEEAIDDLACQALGLEIKEEPGEQLEDYALVLHGTRDQLLDLRRYMTKTGVTYEKLASSGAGVYTLTN